MKEDMPRRLDIEYVLEFIVRFSKEMILSGANIERVQIAIDKICRAYALREVDLFLLSTQITISATDSYGNFCIRQGAIPGESIHLERLRKLNTLSFKICEAKPAPRDLMYMLRTACKVEEYGIWAVVLGQMTALACLCIMFGGGPMEILCVELIVILLAFLTRRLSYTGINRVITNTIAMCIGTITGILLSRLIPGTQDPIIVTTIIMLLLPGIPLVNAARNFLCGNEMNGILQAIKALIETISLAGGIYLGIVLVGGSIEVTSVSLPVAAWIILQFLASGGFAVGFRILGTDLIIAGLCGVFSRIILLFAQTLTDKRFLYVLFAAFVASLVCEFLATKRKQPSTYFIYPSIIPLIPGDLFFFAIAGIYLKDVEMFEYYSMQCGLALLAMSLGFVLSSTVAVYIRKWHIRQLLSMNPLEYIDNELEFEDKEDGN